MPDSRPSNDSRCHLEDTLPGFLRSSLSPFPLLVPAGGFHDPAAQPSDSISVSLLSISCFLPSRLYALTSCQSSTDTIQEKAGVWKRCIEQNVGSELITTFESIPTCSPFASPLHFQPKLRSRCTPPIRLTMSPIIFLPMLMHRSCLSIQLQLQPIFSVVSVASCSIFRSSFATPLKARTPHRYHYLHH